MAIPRYRAKRDKTEGPIVDLLKKVGFTVQPLSSHNVPDLLLGYRGKNYLVEVKSEKGKLSNGQKEWHLCWNGQVDVLYSVDDAQKFIYNVTNNSRDVGNAAKKEQSSEKSCAKKL